MRRQSSDTGHRACVAVARGLCRIACSRDVGRRIALVVALGIASSLAAPAAAQSCFSWSTGFGPPPGALGLNGPIYAMTVFDEDGWGPGLPSLFVGGHFSSAGTVAVNNLARWDGTEWHDVAGGVTGDSGYVLSLAVVDLDGDANTAPSLYVGGDFTTAGSGGGATAAANIACWNGLSWSALGAGTAGNGGFVWSIAEFKQDPTGARLYIGGDFTSAGGVTLNYIARWNGTTWSALGATVGTSGGVFALQPFNDGSGPALFVGGAFPTAGLVDPNTKFVAKWNGTAWSSLGPGLNSTVNALAVWDADGPGPLPAVLAAGGNFSMNGNSTAALSRVATWNGAAWSALAGGMSARVRTLASFDDECGRSLYAGGEFTTFTGNAFNYVARWNGGAWKACGAGSISWVRALKPFFASSGSVSALYAGGEFGAMGGNPSAFIAQWIGGDADGDGLYDCWEAIGQGIDVNCDGHVDLDLHDLGARVDHKDIFVEVDAMAGLMMSAGAKADVTHAFDIAPVDNPDGAPGIHIHIQLDDPSIASPPVAWTIDDVDGDGQADWPTEFDAAKTIWFGTSDQRTDPLILAAKRLAYRYCIFAQDFDASHSSGLSEIGGNDFMVTLGGWSTPGGTRKQQSGTFMHELGHTMGLYHGGNQIDPANDRRYNFKPNYHSVMNYTWQSPKAGYDRSWYLDYSRDKWDDLNENAIAEAAGMGGNRLMLVPVGPLVVPGAGGPVLLPTRLINEGGPAILDLDLDTDDTYVYDINHIRIGPGEPATPGGQLKGCKDWPLLDYNFRDSGDFGDGVHATPSILDEFDLAAEADLSSIPPPSTACPADVVANGAVDVADLLAVIVTWGECVDCTSAAGCPGDIAPVTGSDCIVNVADLLMVILNWGACP